MLCKTTIFLLYFTNFLFLYIELSPVTVLDLAEDRVKCRWAAIYNDGKNRSAFADNLSSPTESPRVSSMNSLSQRNLIPVMAFPVDGRGRRTGILPALDWEVAYIDWGRDRTRGAKEDRRLPTAEAGRLARRPPSRHAGRLSSVEVLWGLGGPTYRLPRFVTAPGPE